MKVVLTEHMARRWGTAIRRAAPRAKLITPSLAPDGSVAWSADPAGADLVLLSQDLWEDLEARAKLIGAFFRIEGVRWLHTFSAGVDAPPFKTMAERGAVITNSSGASAPAIAQYVLAQMLARVVPLDAWRDQQRRREWRQFTSDEKRGELTGLTCGIVGTGAIGGEVARLAKAAGMRTVGIRRSSRRTRDIDEQLQPAQLPRLLRQSDFVVLACPLTPETEGLIGERELRAMKPTATLVNIARGKVVDEPALVRALRDGAIAHAVLDVFWWEPLPDDSPLWDMDNVTITPHNAGPSPLNAGRVMAIVLENIARYAAGKPLRNTVVFDG